MPCLACDRSRLEQEQQSTKPVTPVARGSRFRAEPETSSAPKVAPISGSRFRSEPVEDSEVEEFLAPVPAPVAPAPVAAPGLSGRRFRSAPVDEFQVDEEPVEDAEFQIEDADFQFEDQVPVEDELDFPSLDGSFFAADDDDDDDTAFEYQEIEPEPLVEPESAPVSPVVPATRVRTWPEVDRRGDERRVNDRRASAFGSTRHDSSAFPFGPIHRPPVHKAISDSVVDVPATPSDDSHLIAPELLDSTPTDIGDVIATGVEAAVSPSFAVQEGDLFAPAVSDDDIDGLYDLGGPSDEDSPSSADTSSLSVDTSSSADGDFGDGWFDYEELSYGTGEAITSQPFVAPVEEARQAPVEVDALATETTVDDDQDDDEDILPDGWLSDGWAGLGAAGTDEGVSPVGSDGVVTDDSFSSDSFSSDSLDGGSFEWPLALDDEDEDDSRQDDVAFEESPESGIAPSAFGWDASETSFVEEGAGFDDFDLFAGDSIVENGELTSPAPEVDEAPVGVSDDLPDWFDFDPISAEGLWPSKSGADLSLQAVDADQPAGNLPHVPFDTSVDNLFANDSDSDDEGFESDVTTGDDDFSFGSFESFDDEPVTAGEPVDEKAPQNLSDFDEMFPSPWKFANAAISEEQTPAAPVSNDWSQWNDDEEHAAPAVAEDDWASFGDVQAVEPESPSQVQVPSFGSTSAPGMRALAGMNDVGTPWWLESMPSAQSENDEESYDDAAGFDDDDAWADYATEDDEEDEFAGLRSSGSVEKSRQAMNRDPDFDDELVDFGDDDFEDWDFEDDEDVAPAKPAPRGQRGQRAGAAKGRPEPRRRPVAAKSFDVQAALQNRSRVMVIGAIILAVLVLCSLASNVFSRVGAAPDPNAVQPELTCAGTTTKSAKNAGSLQALLPVAPNGWQVVADHEAGTGAIDFSKALRLESNANEALAILDSTRFRSGYDRSYSGSNGTKANAAVYDFANAICAQQYVKTHGEKDAVVQTFDVPGIPDAKGSVQMLDGQKAYVIRASSGTHAMTITSRDKGATASAVSGAVALASQQWTLLTKTNSN